MSDVLTKPADAAVPILKIPPARLGEELPIFCERCGYSLHGLIQRVCERCAIRHFHCPECGHTQPINTLRPAVQRVIGRIRGWVLSAVVFGKIALFGFVFFLWFLMGAEWCYTWSSERAAYSVIVGQGIGQGPYPAAATAEMLWAFALFGVAFGFVARMMLLRWRIGAIVGIWIGTLAVAAVLAGARFSQWDRGNWVSPFTGDFSLATLVGFGAIVLGAAAVWPLWSGLALIFLPARTAKALLAWQSSLSESAAPALGRG